MTTTNVDGTLFENQIVLRTSGELPDKQEDILDSGVFEDLLKKFLADLVGRRDPLLEIIGNEPDVDEIVLLLRKLAVRPSKEISKTNPELNKYFKNPYLLNLFVEKIYNFWRSHERYIICYEFQSNQHHNRPFRTFSHTISRLNDHVRGVYRDIQENITGMHPRIYRQVAAGCQVGIISKDQKQPLPEDYKKLEKIQIVRQVLLEPPLILDPPMNKRTGLFEPIDKNILSDMSLDPKEFICYPAKVGDLIIHVYFHIEFIGLGISMCNLFDIANSEDLKRKPDAFFVYGAPEESMKKLSSQIVYFDDEKNGTMIGFIPKKEEFGYFGYVKKMILTLHNIIQIKRGRLPIHGAMVCIKLKDGSAANVAIVGDSGAGKSESLEALRVLSEENIRDMTLIFDDMGSFELRKDEIAAFGTETGAFVRLDDLQPGFAYGAIDRSIIMSPQKINARALLPVTTIEEVLYGHKVDFLLYANNYEKTDSSHPALEWLKDTKEAFNVFKKGVRMAKGTTSETGITESYFANPFGPPQKREVHEKIAEKFFTKFEEFGVKVGVLRTQLGINGLETEGPRIAARALFEEIRKKE